MQITRLSAKQKTVLKWCHMPTVRNQYNSIICDGAVRSGKTVCMILSYIHWAMRFFDGVTFAICGKTVQSAERNIITPLQGMQDVTAYYSLSYARSNKLLTVKNEDTTNYFYVFGGKDEGSAALIQGLTLAGVFFDEVALMPQSFVEQAIARTVSTEAARLWFNCNPSTPAHWFYKEWILKKEQKNALHLHFTMQDNPAMTPRMIQKASEMFSGVFYERYIRGRWVVAEGLIYPMFDEKTHVASELPTNGRYYISIDYGTYNPFSAGLWCVVGAQAYRINEFYYSGRKNAPKTDEEYYHELQKLAGNRYIESIVIDPSASSFIECIRRHGLYRVKRANNEVIGGIYRVASLLNSGKIKIGEACSDCIREFGLYVWDDKSPTDRPIKENDHAMDDVRYFVNTILRKEFKWLDWGEGYC